ncbi:MAG TPA: TolC family protein [Bryobacteraceae bacterium]|nr:TolC family protein [Bryobacteraceae bacterium]HPT25492.1 TolC family protein [Bryobacteraceae bacterium]
MIFRTAVLILTLIAALGAQDKLSLPAAIEAALGAHPDIAAARARVDYARGTRRQAGLTLNPHLVLQAENLRRSTTGNPFSYSQQADTFAYIQQQFEAGGKRTRRVEAADAAMAALNHDLAMMRLDVAARVKDAYWAAAGVQQAFELLETNQKTFQQIVEYHEIRVREGAMAESDLLRVRLEADRIALAANQARLDAQRARIQLFRAMGQSTFPEVALITSIALTDDPLITPDIATSLERRPDVLAARANVEAARAGLRLQRANARTDYSLLFGYKRTEGYNTVMGGVQWELPWRNRNQGNIESASASIHEAEARLAATEATARAEIEAANSEYLIRRRQVHDFIDHFRQQASDTSRIAQAAYRLGGADLLRLLDAERLRIEIEILSVQSAAQYRQSKAALESAMGIIQ